MTMGGQQARRAGRRPVGTALALAAALSVAALTGCASDPVRPVGDGPASTTDAPAGAFPPATSGDRTSSERPVDDIDVRFTPIASVGSTATTVMSDPERTVLFVGRRDGQILRIQLVDQDGFTVPELDDEPALDLSKDISTDVERGLFDLQLLPDGKHVAVSYSAADGAITVRLLSLDDDELVDDVENSTVVSIPHTFAGHNGGDLAMTADGNLLLSLGDMDLKTLTPPTAQDPSTPLGGILEIPAPVLEDADARPFEATFDHAIAKGLRNPWRISRDEETDRLWIGDVGESTWEEIDTIPDVSTTDELQNFGWPAFEGTERFPDGSRELGPGTVVEPLRTYRHDEDTCAVTGGFVYRGSAIPDLVGTYLFSDVCSSKVSGIQLSEGKVTSEGTLGTAGTGIVSFGQDAQGELYVLDMAGGGYRVDPGSWSVPGVETAPTETEDPRATTTTPVVPTADECRLPNAIIALSDVTALDPATGRQRMTELLALLTKLESEVPSERREPITVLLKTFTDLSNMAASVGWDASDPRVAEAQRKVTSGEPPYQDFSAAVTAVMELGHYCP